LNPFFIFGLGPLPRMGVQGAALTTVVGFSVASLQVLSQLRNRSRKVHWDRSAWRYDPQLLRDLAIVAGPAFIANMSTSVSVYLINAQISAYGTEVLAAFGVGIRLLSFVFLPTLGVSMGMLIMVGQNHGADQRRRAARITMVTLGFCLSLLATLAVPVIVFPREALSIFTGEAAVIAAGVPLARYVTMARPMLSIANITAFWFQARGRGIAGMIPNLLMRVIMEPLGLYVGLQAGGLLGGWLGMATGGFIGGTLCLALLLWRLRVYVRAEDAPG
jgi:Na+-driven multidrug efflux pump